MWQLPIINKLMRRGKKKAFCILALAACLGLAGCSPVKVINKVWRGEEVSDQIQIVYRIASLDPTEEEIEDTAHKLLMRAKLYSNEAHVESRGTDRILVFLPSEVNEDIDIEDLAEELSTPGELNFLTEDGVVLDGGDVKSAEVKKAGSGKSDSEKNGRTSDTKKTDKESDDEEYLVELEFTEAGAEIFAEVTQANIGKKISIVYDGKLIASPVVQAAIVNGKASISNVSSKEEAEALARMIRIGGLSLELELYEIIED